MCPRILGEHTSCRTVQQQTTCHPYVPLSRRRGGCTGLAVVLQHQIQKVSFGSDKVSVRRHPIGEADRLQHVRHRRRHRNMVSSDATPEFLALKHALRAEALQVCLSGSLKLARVSTVILNVLWALLVQLATLPCEPLAQPKTTELTHAALVADKLGKPARCLQFTCVLAGSFLPPWHLGTCLCIVCDPDKFIS